MRRIAPYRFQEEAQELARRFPNLPDFEVIEHIEYVFRVQIPPNTIWAWDTLQAYRKEVNKCQTK